MQINAFYRIEGDLQNDFWEEWNDVKYNQNQRGDELSNREDLQMGIENEAGLSWVGVSEFKLIGTRAPAIFQSGILYDFINSNDGLLITSCLVWYVL